MKRQIPIIPVYLGLTAVGAVAQPGKAEPTRAPSKAPFKVSAKTAAKPAVKVAPLVRKAPVTPPLPAKTPAKPSGPAIPAPQVVQPEDSAGLADERLKANETAPELTLEDALALALRDNPRRAQAQASVDEAEAGIKGAGAQGKLQVDLSGSSTLSKNTGSSIPAKKPATGAVTGFTRADNLTVDASLPITTGGKVRAETKAARYNALAQIYALARVDQELVLETTIAYLDVLRANQLLDVANSNLSVSRERLRIASLRFSVGAAAKLDVLRAQSDLSDARTRRIQAVSDIGTANAALNVLMARAPETPMRLEVVTNLQLPNLPELAKAGVPAQTPAGTGKGGNGNQYNAGNGNGNNANGNEAKGENAANGNGNGTNTPGNNANGGNQNATGNGTRIAAAPGQSDGRGTSGNRGATSNANSGGANGANGSANQGGMNSGASAGASTDNGLGNGGTTGAVGAGIPATGSAPRSNSGGAAAGGTSTPGGATAAPAGATGTAAAGGSNPVSSGSGPGRTGAAPAPTGGIATSGTTAATAATGAGTGTVTTGPAAAGSGAAAANGLLAASPSALNATAATSRESLAVTQAQIGAALANVDVAKAGKKPSLGVSLTSLLRNPATYLGHFGLAIGLGLAQNLFDSGKTRSQVDEAQAVVAQLRAQYVGQQLDVAKAIETALLTLDAAQRRENNAADGVAAAREALRVANVGFRSGVRTTLDIADAQAGLLSAETEQVNARFDVADAQAALAAAVGLYTEEASKARARVIPVSAEAATQAEAQQKILNAKANRVKTPRDWSKRPPARH